MSLRFILFLLLVPALLVNLQRYNTALAESTDNQILNKVEALLNSNGVYSALTNTQSSVADKKVENFEHLTSTSNYTSYATKESTPENFTKIVVAKESLGNLTFQKWLQNYAQGDDVTELIEKKQIKIENKTVELYRYMVRVHEEQRHSVLYVDLGKSIMMIAIYGDPHQTFEELEEELWRFANEL